ncbi:MAG: DNA primase [Lachnospiraceae bacterium]|nr:DNA primase [Lachnospiraceae bacterium]
MYYSDDVVEEVRMRNPIVDVVGSYVQLKRSGANYFGLCPFHNERSASFSVSPQKQMYYCFGCHAAGNVITFVMQYENFSFQEALQFLAERAGMTLPEATESRESIEARDRRSVLLKMHKDAAVFYHRYLKSPEGKNGYQYLKARALSDETIVSFGLGFAGPRPDLLYRYLKQQGYTDAQMKDGGLVSFSERGAFDRFWNRVIYPIMDANSHVIAFGGRVLGDGQPKYLNSPETMIFDKSRNLYGLNVARRTREKYFIICEGYMDVIALHQAGFTNAVAALGTSFTPQHGAIIRRYVKEAVLCFDSDGAGKNAALRAIPILREAGLNIRVLSMTPYKDPDEFIRGLGADAFRERIRDAANAFLFEIRMLRGQYDLEDPQGRSDFFNETARRIAVTFPDPVERTSYAESVAREFRFDPDTLKSKITKNGEERGLSRSDPERYRPASSRKTNNTESSAVRAEKLVLTLLAEHPERFGEVEKQLKEEDFSSELSAGVAKLLYRQLREEGKANPAAIISRYIDDERSGEVSGLFSSEFSAQLSEEALDQAIREAVYTIKDARISEAMAKVTDAAELIRLMEEKKKLKKPEGGQ